MLSSTLCNYASYCTRTQNSHSTDTPSVCNLEVLLRLPWACEIPTCKIFLQSCMYRNHHYLRTMCSLIGWSVYAFFRYQHQNTSWLPYVTTTWQRLSCWYVHSAGSVKLSGQTATLYCIVWVFRCLRIWLWTWNISSKNYSLRIKQLFSVKDQKKMFLDSIARAWGWCLAQ